MEKNTILLGISGGIAAIKIPQLIHSLRKHPVTVLPIMTESATKIVDPKEISTAAQQQVHTQLFQKNYSAKQTLKNRSVDHIEISKAADLAVIAPATANIIGKLAHGIADDLLTTTMLATTCPVLIYPSMNTNMWNNPIVQNNVIKLKSYGYIVAEPETGMLACGDDGKGRLPNTSTITEDILSILNKSSLLKEKTVIVTSGGTSNPIDGVRVITNRSSGKMGTAIAEACYLQGARVILLKAKHSVSSRYPLEEYLFETTKELHILLKQFTPQADACFHVAAVGDFLIKKLPGKIDSHKKTTLNLIPQPKLYQEIKTLNPHIFLITFKAEWNKSTRQLIHKAQKTLKSESMDAIIVNDVSKPNQGFAVDTNAVIIVKPNGSSKILPLKSKKQLAVEIVSNIFTL